MLVGNKQPAVETVVIWICVAGFTNGSGLFMPRNFAKSNT